MNYSELIKYVSDEAGVKNEDTKIVVDIVLKGIKQGLCNDGAVKLKGFGTFKRVTRKARMARDPNTDQQIHVPARDTVKFDISRDLACKLNDDKL